MSTINYITEHGPNYGVRFSIKSPPSIGTTLVLSEEREVRFDGIGMAGMLEVTDATGLQYLIFPWQVFAMKGPAQ